MLIIEDAVHGAIQLNELESSLIDCPSFQRLRRLRQLAFAFLVFPGANHTRFEHSLGTMKLTGDICAKLSIKGEEAETLRAAALLHDVGHPALSHEAEQTIKRLSKKSHESIGAERITKSELADVISAHGHSPKKIASLVTGGGKAQVFTGDLGSDRMDYLVRDSLYTGVAYGVIDFERLIQRMHWKNNTLAIDEGGLAAAESLLMARFLMFSTVYFHHTVRIASAMLNRAISNAISKQSLSLEEISSFDDAKLLARLRESQGWFAAAIEERKLFKRAFEALPSTLKAVEAREAEAEIASLAGVRKEEVIIDLPSSWEKELSISVTKNGSEKHIEELSVVVASLKKAEADRLKLMVACPAKDAKKVNEACGKYFKRRALRQS